MAAASEDDVNIADGHYAIDMDGVYLVDYRLDMEVGTAVQSDQDLHYSVSSFQLTLDGVNQPVDIELTSACVPAP